MLTTSSVFSACPIRSSPDGRAILNTPSFDSALDLKYVGPMPLESYGKSCFGGKREILNTQGMMLTSNMAEVWPDWV